MAYIFKSFSNMFGVNDTDYKSKKSNKVNNSNNMVIVNTQPKKVFTKNNIIRRKQNALKYGPKLAQLSNDIAQKTPEETKVLTIIEYLKYHPEKEPEILAKYGKLIKKHQHLFTEKNAYGKKKSKKSKKTKKSKKSKKK